MVEIREYPPALKQNGWDFKEKCNCSGILKYKFVNKDYPNIVIEWWVKYFAFRVTDGVKTAKGQTPLAQLPGYISDMAFRKKLAANASVKPAAQKLAKVVPTSQTKPTEVVSNEATTANTQTLNTLDNALSEESKTPVPKKAKGKTD